MGGAGDSGSQVPAILLDGLCAPGGWGRVRFVLAPHSVPYILAGTW